MSDLLGVKRKISIATEDTLGVAATTGFRSAILHTDGLQNDVPPVEDPGIMGDMATEVKEIQGAYDIKGSLGDNTLYPTGAFPLILLHTLGSVSTEQQGSTAAYKHTYAPVARTNYGNTKGLTIASERDLSSAHIFTGCVSNKLTVKWTRGQVLTWVSEIFGIGQSTGDSPTLTKPTINPFVSFDVALTIDGSSIPVDDGSLVIENNFNTDFYNGRSRLRFPRKDFMKITGSFSKKVLETADEAKFFTKFKAHTSAALVITVTGSQIEGAYNYVWYVSCPVIYYRDLGNFANGGRDVPSLAANFQAKGQASGTEAISTYIINNETSVS